jgi:hypothetical protein
VPGAKLVLTSLWGALQQRDSQRRRYAKGDVVPADRVLISLHPVSEGIWDVETRGPNIFAGLAPAFGCFLTALGRAKMATTIRPFADRVVRIHTDGVCLAENEEQKEMYVSAELGSWNIERKGKVIVKNANVVTWA